MLFINLIPSSPKKEKLYINFHGHWCVLPIYRIFGGVESGNTMSAIVVLFIIGENQKKNNLFLMLFICLEGWIQCYC